MSAYQQYVFRCTNLEFIQEGCENGGKESDGWSGGDDDDDDDDYSDDRYDDVGFPEYSH